MIYGTAGYLNCNNGILMLKKIERKNDPNSGLCALPGGKLESCEKGLDNLEGRANSAIRETNAETGITLINPVFAGVILFDNKDRTFPNWKNPDNFLVYYFKANEYSGKFKKSNEGIPFWAKSFKEIESLPKNPGDKFMYEWLKDGRNFFGVIKHNGNEVDKSGTWVDFY